MTTPAPDAEVARNHVFHCQQYMDNALEALQKNEPGKAGEMLWGSITQAVHAVDAWRGTVIYDHHSMMNFVYHRIGREINDDSFSVSVEAAGSLHHNFYMPARTTEDVELMLPAIGRAIGQILALLPVEARNGSTSG